MNSKSLPIIIGVILIVAVGGLVYFQSTKTSAPVTTPGQTDTGSTAGTATTTTTTTSSYTMAEVATHNSSTSCWTVIDGGVYDLTKWIPQHPGGEGAIESICGIDGSSAFHGQHDHAARQENILATFKIGTLAQ
jgi:cytochrome b involved in lipid metabolism